MTPVKTQARFRCAFCSKVAPKGAMARHEKRCFFNPDRDCEMCQNRGYITHGYWGVPKSIHDENCPNCEKCEKARAQVTDWYKHAMEVGATKISPTVAKWVATTQVSA